MVSDPQICINAKFATPSAHQAALKGIENPTIGFLPSGATLYRFGGNRLQASMGSWWFGQEQYAQIAQLAALNRLSFAYSARILSAVLHEYNNMTELFSVRTKTKLIILKGESLKQQGRLASLGGRWVAGDQINKPTTALSKPFIQYFIPGLNDRSIYASALTNQHLVRLLPPGDSHMFGVKGAPKGAMLQ